MARLLSRQVIKLWLDDVDLFGTITAVSVDAEDDGIRACVELMATQEVAIDHRLACATRKVVRLSLKFGECPRQTFVGRLVRSSTDRKASDEHFYDSFVFDGEPESGAEIRAGSAWPSIEISPSGVVTMTDASGASIVLDGGKILLRGHICAPGQTAGA